MKTVRYHPINTPIPEGWKLSTHDLGHHSMHSVLIEQVFEVSIAAAERVVSGPLSRRTEVLP